MNGYRRFMDRQALSELGRRRLLALAAAPAPKARRQGGRYMKFGVLAACAALLIGLGSRLWTPADPVVPPIPSVPAAATPAPALSNDVGLGDRAGFTAAGPGEGLKWKLPNIHAVDYADVTQAPQLSASLALPEGAFSVPLSKKEVQRLFWGPQGKPAVTDPKTDPGDFPLLLMNWAGYAVTAQATYDGKGDLWELCLRGEKGEDSFVLRSAPGRVPPTCVVESGAVTTDVDGVAVSGWYRSYDRDGDGALEHVCTSEFLANGVGFRFENVGSGGLRAGMEQADDLGGAMRFNEMAVTQLCYEDGFYLDQFAHNGNIPDWAKETYETLAQAVAGAESFALSHPEADFLAYLPTEGPEGFGEFFGRLSYQEGALKHFSVRWSRGCDDVEVTVRLPEGESNDWLRDCLVDVNVPESYDWRLYDLPICDNVPQEYQDNFYSPAFRAQDMSPEVVRARMTDKDTGGESCNFWVLFENGAAVSYSCSGVSAEYVWSLVEAALP